MGSVFFSSSFYRIALQQLRTVNTTTSQNIRRDINPRRTMCCKSACKNCGKWSWRGCGLHIESALRGIPLDERCKGWQTGKCPNTANIYSNYINKKSSDYEANSPRNCESVKEIKAFYITAFNDEESNDITFSSGDATYD